MESATDYSRVGLVEVVSLADAPAGVGDGIVWRWCSGSGCGRFIRHFLVFSITFAFTGLGSPGKYSTIPTDRINLATCMSAAGACSMSIIQLTVLESEEK